MFLVDIEALLILTGRKHPQPDAAETQAARDDIRLAGVSRRRGVRDVVALRGGGGVVGIPSEERECDFEVAEGCCCG
jgi:hypothetical protein